MNSNVQQCVFFGGRLDGEVSDHVIAVEGLQVSHVNIMSKDGTISVYRVENGIRLTDKGSARVLNYVRSETWKGNKHREQICKSLKEEIQRINDDFDTRQG